MLHAEDTLQRWLELERVEHEFRRWAAFFYAQIDKPEQAHLLCEIGLRVARREMPAGEAARAAVERILRARVNEKIR